LTIRFFMGKRENTMGKIVRMTASEIGVELTLDMVCITLYKGFYEF